MPLTAEQKKLYLDLQNAIYKKEDITDLLKQVEKNDFIEVFTTNGTKVKCIDSDEEEKDECIDLISYAAVIDNAEGLKAIFNYCKKNSISVASLFRALKKDIDLSSSTELHEVQFDGKKVILAILNQLKEVGGLKEFWLREFFSDEQSSIVEPLPTSYFESYLECLNESEDNEIDVGLLVNKLSDKGILKEVISIIKGDVLEELKDKLKYSDNYDALGKIYQAEKGIATNKAIVVGAIGGVIAGLAVGGGLFAAGVTLPMLAIIGIAVAAAVLTGLIAGGITYEMSKPSNGLNEVNAQQKVSQESEVTA